MLAVELTVVAYVLGHVMAHFSSWIFEQVVMGRLLGRPAPILLGATPRLRFSRWIFPNYFRPLPKTTQERVNVQARNHEIGNHPVLFSLLQVFHAQPS